MPDMKIRHVLPGHGYVPRNPENSAFGGITVAAWELAIRQAETDHLQIIGLSREGRRFHTTHKGVELTGILPWYWARWGKRDFRYFAPLLVRSLFARPDILHCYSGPALLSMPAQARLLHLQNVLPPADRAAHHKALSKADAIICCSQFVRRRLLDDYEGLTSKTYVVHNGGKRHKPSGRSLRAELDIAADTTVVLFVGMVTAEKGLHVLIEAIRHILDEHKDVALLVAGSSKLWYKVDASASISAYESSLRAGSRSLPIFFLGHVSQNRLADVYHSADIFCCPSVWDEPFGIVNVEAMMSGLPVIASAVGGIPEVVNDDVGKLVPPNNVDALASALCDLINSPDLRTQLASNAIERAECFTWDRTHESINEIYAQIRKKT